MNEKPLADVLELWGFVDDVMVFSDGSFGVALRATPIDVTTWDDDQVNGLATRTANFLNGLPEGLDLQFVQDIARGSGDLITRHANLTSPAADVTARRLTEERTRRLTVLDDEGKLPFHSLLVLARRKPVSSLVSRPRLFGRPKHYEQISDARLVIEVSATRQLRQDLIQGLQALGAQVTALEPPAILDLVYDQWNPGRTVPRPDFDTEDIREGLLFTDVGVEADGFSLGLYKHRLISIKSLPDVTYGAMAAKLRDLPFDSRLSLTIHVPNQQKETQALQTQRRLAFAMVHGKRAGVSDIESQAKLDDLEGLLESMIAQGERVFRVGTTIVLRGKDEAELDRQVSATLRVLREMAGTEGMVESLAAFDLFTSTQIPQARVAERIRRLKTSNLADMLPLYGPWRGHPSASILLRSRLGSLVGFDPFASELTNANQLVSGGSGSGKSFATNILLLHLLKEFPRIFIIDIGSSYRKLCDALGGQYIPLGVGSGDSLNPFDRADGPRDDSHKVKLLLGLVELMTKEEGAERLPKLERAELERLIQETLATKQSPLLSDLRTLLLGSSDPGIARLGRVLTPWCGDTPYGQFVDRPTTVKLERRVVCFDLKGMEAYPDLQAVCLLLITDYIWREVQRDRESKKVVVFDECWKIMENEAGAAFLGEIFRTFRKYYASAIAISQNIDDFAKSRIAGAVMPNSAIKWILRQKGADLDRLKTTLGLNECEMDLVSSLRQERGVYSEAFLMAQDNHMVVAVESTPLEYWLATTDPRELAAIDQAIAEDQSKSRLEVLEQLAASYPRGLLST